MKLLAYILPALIAALLPDIQAQSSRPVRCATDELSRAELRLHPERAHEVAALETAYRHHIQQPALREETECEVYIIPTVVHIIYEDESSNLSDEQVLSQFEVLNQDYRRVFGSPGYGNGVDMHIQLCLASVDPQGQPTTGITRTQSTLTRHNSANDQALKDLIRWDPERYLNIWVVKSIGMGAGNTLGYTYLPGTVPRERDGVVITGKYVGTTGTATPPYNHGRTLTHEVGHFLGLHHTFREEGACSDTSEADCLLAGDKVCDTPTELEPKYFCPDETNSCREFPCDQPDPIHNYLNYVDDVCMNEFTAGQKMRALQFLREYRALLISRENLQATGCAGMPIRHPRPEARFRASSTAVCVGSKVSFEDRSEGCVQARMWEFPGAEPEVSTAAKPTVTYSAPGWYDVRLRVMNDSASDEKLRRAYIYVSAGTGPHSMSHQFETGTLLPPGWQVADEDEQGGWLLTTLASSQGLGAALVRNFQLNGKCTADMLISPVFDLSDKGSASLTFDYAYRLRRQQAFPADRLRVELSTDCGESYPIMLLDRYAEALATTDGFEEQQPFIPAGPDDWASVSLDLSPYTQRSGLRIRFVNIGGGGQQLYLDNIHLSTTVDLPSQLGASLRLLPNPFEEQAYLQLRLPRPMSLRLSLYNLHGRQLWQSEQWQAGAGMQQYSLPLSLTRQLPGGMYLLRIQAGKTQLQTKLLKQ